jgi:hypothetical protein
MAWVRILPRLKSSGLLHRKVLYHDLAFNSQIGSYSSGGLSLDRLLKSSMTKKNRRIALFSSTYHILEKLCSNLFKIGSVMKNAIALLF